MLNSLLTPCPFSTLPGRMVLAENGAASTLPMRDHKNSTPLPQKSDRFGGCKYYSINWTFVHTESINFVIVVPSLVSFQTVTVGELDIWSD